VIAGTFLESGGFFPQPVTIPVEYPRDVVFDSVRFAESTQDERYRSARDAQVFCYLGMSDPPLDQQGFYIAIHFVFLVIWFSSGQ